MKKLQLCLATLLALVFTVFCNITTLAATGYCKFTTTIQKRLKAGTYLLKLTDIEDYLHPNTLMPVKSELHRLRLPIVIVKS